MREVVDRNRNLPRYRPLMHRARRLARRRWRPCSARKRELPDVMFEQTPTREYPDRRTRRASVRLRRRDHRSAARRGPSIEGCRPGAFIGQAGIEQTYNKLLMGRDGARVVTVNSIGREISEDERQSAHRGPAPPADDRLRHPEGRAGRLRGHRLPGLGGDARSAQRRDSRARQPPGLRSQRVLGRHRREDLGPAADRQAACRCRTAPSRAAIRPGRRSRLSSPWPASRRASSRPRPACSVPAAPISTAATSSATPAARTAASTCATRSRSRATSTSTRSATMVGIDRLHKWATALGLGVMSGIDLPHEIEGIMPSRAWKKREDGREVVRGRDDLGVDRPGRRCR